MPQRTSLRRTPHTWPASSLVMFSASGVARTSCARSSTRRSSFFLIERTLVTQVSIRDVREGSGLGVAPITMWIERMSRSPTPSHSIDHEVSQLHHGQYFRAWKRKLQAAFRAHANAPPLEAMERIENPQSTGPTRSLPHISLFPFAMSGFLTCYGHPILGRETLSLHFC
jgi:hypothetical protein